jgi:Na+-translocating ferredoxin:NAD+ oxidoreductase RnfG subunit
MSWRRARWSVSWQLLAPVAALTAPAPVFAVDYLTVEQAERQLFPEADAFEVRDVALDAAQRDALKARLGVTPRERWRLRLARHGQVLAGVVVIDDVIGKFERITYATAIAADGKVAGIEILSYRESHGHEVRLPAWRKQFVGKTADSALRVGEDISNISGATLSCQHVTDGVRRIVTVVDALRQAGALR